MQVVISIKRCRSKSKNLYQGYQFRRATQLIEHRASIEEPGTKTPDNLLRLAIGLENVDDLIEDLAQALGEIE